MYVDLHCQRLMSSVKVSRLFCYACDYCGLYTAFHVSVNITFEFTSLVALICLY